MTQRLRDEPGMVVGLGLSARQVLDHLHAASTPVSTAEVAERTGLHLNTARFHLDRLVSMELAVRVAEERDVPGRPRILYSARRRVSGPRSFRLLATILGGLVAELDRDGTAGVDAGRAWGRHLVERASPARRIAAGEAVERVAALMDDLGFEPTVVTGADRTTSLHLHHCPFVEVVEEQAAVVCGLHRGLIEGAIGELRAPVEVEELLPFAAPSLCVARLRDTAADGLPHQRRTTSRGLTPSRWRRAPSSGSP